MNGSRRFARQNKVKKIKQWAFHQQIFLCQDKTKNKNILTPLLTLVSYETQPKLICIP